MYSDDDYQDDYDQFDEDALNDEDYELLHDMLPPFRENVKNNSYNDIPDSLLKEYIWESNFDPEEAFLIVQENHKRTYLFFSILFQHSNYFLSLFPCVLYS